MKGISVIIATIILVVITIGLVSTAYLYIMGLIKGRTATNIELVYSYCNSTGHMSVIVKNIGTSNITTTDIDFIVDGSSKSCSNTGEWTGDIGSGDAKSCVISLGSGATGYHDLTVVGPSNAISAKVECR